MKKLFLTLIVFTSLANVSAQIEINSSGQVGVGTTTPQHKLDVAGNARVTGNIYFGNSASNFLGTLSNIPIIFKVNNVMAGFTGNSSITNISFGYGALKDLTGSNNVAVGFNALYSNTTGNSNTANGYRALYLNTTGEYNTATRENTLNKNTTGSYNTANGRCALYSNTDGNYNTANGHSALYFNTTGNYNTATGGRSLNHNTTGNENTAHGYRALDLNKTGIQNTANGSQALANNETGSNNTASGRSALWLNSIGNKNTANGSMVLHYNFDGNNNTANGYAALFSNTTGSQNTANGHAALYYNTTGNYNSANGDIALYSNTIGNYNTAIGYNADVNADNLNNTTAIGYNAKATASNQVRLGNSSVTSIGGYAAWSNISDGRTKKNIRTEVPGLAFIKLLQPLTYNLDLDAVDELLKSDDPKMNGLRDSLYIEPSEKEKAIEAEAKAKKEKQVYSGFIAQDVEKAARSIGYDFSGVDAPENDKSLYGLRYAEFVVPLVKAVQELSEQNERLQAEVEAEAKAKVEAENKYDAAIASLQKQINELTESVNRLMAKE